MTLTTKHVTSNFKTWKDTVLARVKEKITEFKQKIKPKQTKPVLGDPDVKNYLEELHQKLVIVTSDKASNNYEFLCRKYYISKLLAEVSPNKNKYSTAAYSETQKCNIKYFKKFKPKLTEQEKILSIMYWLPKMHKTPVDARFIVASKNYNTKPLSDVISKIFNMIFSHVYFTHALEISW